MKAIKQLQSSGLSSLYLGSGSALAFTHRNLSRVALGQRLHQFSPSLNPVSVPLNTFRRLITFASNLIEFVFAGKASTASTFNKITLNESVPLRTVGLPLVDSKGTFAPAPILSGSDSLNMGRIDTETPAAQVVTMQTVGQTLHGHLVSEAVSLSSSVLKPKLAVAPLIQARSPFPTGRAVVEMNGRNFDFGKETGEKFSVGSDFATIGVRHIISYSDSVFRLAEKFIPSWRAVSILPLQTSHFQAI